MSTTRRNFSIITSVAISPVFAQSAYYAAHLKTELSGGFSTTVMEPGRAPGKGLDRVRLNGWTAAVTSYQFFRRSAARA